MMFCAELREHSRAQHDRGGLLPARLGAELQGGGGRLVPRPAQLQTVLALPHLPEQTRAHHLPRR